ncbi:MAG: hypothetical protein JXB13_18025 [Phycisphaerae bacterium]|nr:hypothetical protein [Phycisphaerae bacterium]
MNRSHRLKSHMGKARFSHERRRNDQMYHQLLIADFLSEPDPAQDGPVVHRTGGAGAAVCAPATAVRVIEPVEDVVSTGVCGCPAIIIPRTPGANPAIAGVAMRVRSRRPAFRWRAMLTGFLVIAVPGVGLLLLLSVLGG